MTELVREVKHLFHSVRDLEWNFVKSSFYFFLPSSHTRRANHLLYERPYRAADGALGVVSRLNPGVANKYAE